MGEGREGVWIGFELCGAITPPLPLPIEGRG
jgi:hypothetical protein